MPAPDSIRQLVEHFKQNQPSYRSGKFNEAQLRLEFLNPLFEALGWDVSNRSGYAEAYKDVVVEPSLEVEGELKAPDYAFRIGGTRKFFVEAKKPAVNIQYEIYPAFQLRRYAWSAKLPLGILTDFEEFAVYDCRSKPNPTDQAATGRVMFLRYTDYIEQWDEIAGIFSKGAVMKGSFDQYAQGATGKHGTQEVDDAFLKEIEGWRDLLARNLAIRNSTLSVPELNYAVQMTIDRIVFLRICEDRGIEPQEQLKNLLEQEDIYTGLCGLFRQADRRYNSGLFHFEKEKGQSSSADGLSLGLAIDDKALKEIIKSLYFPCPYVFSVIPADILGQVYERFLGKVIRLTEGHQAKVEEKPEVRKAGGVYYTPTYIVEYIVKNTVGKLLEGRTPKEAAELKIVDPACGSGSFLLGAYQYLLDWHTKWYMDNDPQHWAKAASPRVYQAQGGEWKLTTAEKKRILLDSIHGVDIDPQAVEVTKLSLSLKVLEGESQESIGTQLGLFKERALPDLGRNIQCGNSLIGPDYYADRQLELGMERAEERSRVNAFDWQSAFPQVFARGGFDAVIGNPPYIRVRIFKDLYPREAEYLKDSYKCATHVWDIYLLFFEKAVDILRPNGLVSYIIPIQTLHQPNCERLRKLLLEETSVKSIVDLSKIHIFQNAIVKNCIIVSEKKLNKTNKIDIFYPSKPEELFNKPIRNWPQSYIHKNPLMSMKIDLMSEKKLLCEKLESVSWRLEELCYVTFGLRSCAKGVGQGGKERLITLNNDSSNVKPYLEGRDIKRYKINPTGRFIRYIPSQMYSPRDPALFETKKIISQSMLSKMKLVATLDDSKYYVEQSLVCIIPHGIMTEKVNLETLPLEFILGIINSQLENFYFSTSIIDYSLGGGLIHATPGSQSKLVIPKVNGKQINSMVALVKHMLLLTTQLANTPQEREELQREIEATDKQIDTLVYELYGLTEEEIKIVEESK
jgi:hypothetical protein